MSKDQDSYTNQVNELRISPSVQAWEIEIERLVSGKRDHAVLKLGGVQEYVEVLLARSANQEIAISTFHEALRNVVQRWQSSKPSTHYYLSAMLDLIGAYTPAAGFVKVLGNILQWGKFGPNVVGTSGAEDLHLKALTVLRNYFPAAPASVQDALGFSSYADILRELLKDSTYSGHALRRLIELEVLRTTDQEVIDAIRFSVDAVRDLITLFLSLSWRQRASRNLALVYIYATTTGEDVDQVFAEAAALSRARFQPLLPPAIVFENGEVIKFYFTAEEMEEYSRLHDREIRVQEIAEAIGKNREFAKVDELTQILEETLEKGEEDMKRFRRAVDRAGLYLAHSGVGHSGVGPYLYLPHEVVIPLKLRSELLDKYLLTIRFAKEPVCEIQTFFEEVRSMAARR